MLPPLFESEFASATLDDIIRDFDTGDKQSGHPCLVSAKIEEYQVLEYGEPRSWRLSTVDGATAEREPALFRMHGIINDTELPPISKPNSLNAMERMRPHLRQAISLTGINSELFGQNVAQIEKIHVKFGSVFNAGMLKEWKPTYQGTNLTLDMHNRYFIRRSQAPNSERVPFKKGVDPDGYLDNMQKDHQFVHTDDNVVEYYGVGVDERGNVASANPVEFRSGDLVEATIEFGAFPAAGKRFVVIAILRALRMVSSEFRNRAAIFEMRSRYVEPSTQPRAAKRRAIYADGEVNVAAERMKRMQVSKNQETATEDTDSAEKRWKMRE